MIFTVPCSLFCLLQLWLTVPAGVAGLKLVIKSELDGVDFPDVCDAHTLLRAIQLNFALVSEGIGPPNSAP